jgi:hypothetical protein
MSLRSPTENQITLTPGSSPGQALALSPFDDAQGRRWNGRRNFFRTTEHQTRFFFLPSPACGRGEGEGAAEYDISKENAKDTRGPDIYKLLVFVRSFENTEMEGAAVRLSTGP